MCVCVCVCVFALADNAAGQGFNHLEFKIVVEPPDGQSFSVVLLAPSRQEKAAWTSDISQVSPSVQAQLSRASRVKQLSDSRCLITLLSASVHR